MSPLRQRMIDAMILHGMAERTQQAYVAAVEQLTRYYRRSPAELSWVEVQGYLLHLLKERKLSRSTVNQAGCAFRFLYWQVLQRREESFVIPLAPAPQKLPQILSREELSRLFDSAANLRGRTLLMTAYAAGLRLSELCRLKVSDIDSAPDRMCLRIEQGKGARDRYVPLTASLLDELRRYWRAQRPRTWLFAADGAAAGLHPKSVQRCYYQAREQARISKEGGIHTLRHCYATHLLEAGVDLHSIGQWLGHRHLSTTTRYLHLTQGRSAAQSAPLELLAHLPR
jgi:site-specific recombinase XerD